MRRRLPPLKLFGATFTVANFQGQAVRAGMARRFSLITARMATDERLSVRRRRAAVASKNLVESFRQLLEIKGEMDFTLETNAIWADFQNDNRARIDRADALREDMICRLSSAPMQTLAVAMIFQATRWAPWRRRFRRERSNREMLTLAIKHVEECLNTAEFLDGISNRAKIAADAEVMLATIRHENHARANAGNHFC